MFIEQVKNAKLNTWPPERTATRNLNDDFARMVFSVDVINTAITGSIDFLMLWAVTPLSREPFNWEAAEKRADWEEIHGHFAEFTDVKDLLSDLHS